MHAARHLTEAYFRRVTGKHDIAPGLQENISVADAQEPLRDFLRDVMADDFPASLDSVAELSEMLNFDDDPCTAAVHACRATVGLLGSKSYGGLIAIWQLATLGIQVLTPVDQELLNRKIRHGIEDLDREQASEEAKCLGLPSPDYARMGCLGNTAKAYFRAALEGESDSRGPKKLYELGVAALSQITYPFDVLNDPLAIGAMHAMRAGVYMDICVHLQERDSEAENFWPNLTRDVAEGIVTIVERIEPSPKLVAAVQASFRKAFASCI